MPNVLGVQTLDIATDSPGALGVTVPSGTQGVLVGFSCYYDTFTCSASFAGTFTALPQTTGDIRLFAAPVSATGSQTITPDFGTFLVEGPTFFVIFVDGIDNSSIAAWVRDSDSDAAEPTSLTVDSTADDLVLVVQDWYTGESGTPGPPPTASGWTSEATHSYNDRSARLQSADSPGASTTTFTRTTGSGGAYQRLAIVSLIGAGGGGAQTLEPPLTTRTRTVYSPTVAPGAVTLQPPLTTRTRTVYAPVVSQSGGTQTLEPPLTTRVRTVYAPVVVPGAVTLLPPLTTRIRTIYAPSVTTSITISPPLTTRTRTVYAPTVAPGAVTLLPPLVARNRIIYFPEVSGGDPPVATGGLFLPIVRRRRR